MTADSHGDAGLRTWLTHRLTLWQRIEAQVGRLGHGRNHSVDEANEAVTGYRALAHDLSMARRLLPESRITRYLESSYRRTHSLLTRPAHRFFTDLVGIIRDDVPAITRDLRVTLLVVTALFIASGAAGAWLVNYSPELASLFLPESAINDVESGKLWTDGALNIVPGSYLAISLFTNNITVAFTATVLGVIFGLGTFYIVVLNGLQLGGALAFTAQHGLGLRLVEWVIAHGPVELSTVCLASAAGVMLGESLIRPRLVTRLASFQAAVIRAAKYLALCVPLLVVCGLIEGNISTNPHIPFWARALIGGGYWIVAMGLVTGWIWRKRGVTPAVAP
ncbi:MAG TPA: stage II sporulation protein M [Steroidobacteraceae bacterium]|nr:stage II sporulation protein M [Steroidobacteraceae bacterium]